MQLRHLISCAIAALLIAGCSGGGGGGSSTLQPSSAGSGSKATQPVSITLDRGSVGSSSHERNAKFVAASVNDVSYAFVQGDLTIVSGDVALTSTGNNPNCVSNVCTITINAVPIGTYTLNLTLKDNGTAVGGGSSSITVALGGTNSAGVTISPILTGGSAGPSITIASGSVFYKDNEGLQTISASVNELDPVGDNICGSTKSVPNWPTITVSASPTTTGLTIPSPTVSAPPSCPGGSGNVAIDYNNTIPESVARSHAQSVVNTSTVTISASDDTSSKSVTIPFVSLSSSQTTTLSIVDATTANSVTVTETNGFFAGETGFTVTGCNVNTETADVTIGTATAFSQGTSGSPSTETISVTGAITALDSSCTLTIASNVHPALTTSFSLTIAPSVGVSISSRLRAPAR